MKIYYAKQALKNTFDRFTSLAPHRGDEILKIEVQMTRLEKEHEQIGTALYHSRSKIRHSPNSPLVLRADQINHELLILSRSHRAIERRNNGINSSKVLASGLVRPVRTPQRFVRANGRPDPSTGRTTWQDWPPPPTLRRKTRR